MTWLLSLISGNGAGLAAIGAAILAFMGWMQLRLHKARKDGINEQLNKDAKARDKNIEDIIRAGDARPVDGVPDKHDRDTWR